MQPNTIAPRFPSFFLPPHLLCDRDKKTWTKDWHVCRACHPLPQHTYFPLALGLIKVHVVRCFLSLFCFECRVTFCIQSAQMINRCPVSLSTNPGHEYILTCQGSLLIVYCYALASLYQQSIVFYFLSLPSTTCTLYADLVCLGN